MMVAGTFKLTNGTMGISENDRKSVVLIPAGARVVLVDGTLKETNFLRFVIRKECY